MDNPAKLVVRKGFSSATWPVSRNPIVLSPSMMGTAVSLRPAKQVTVAGSLFAPSTARCWTSKQAAQVRLALPNIAQNGFSWV